MENARKGFAVAAILIVIAMTGVLSGMIMFTKHEAEESTRVSGIINNLKNIKFVARAYYSERMAAYNSENDPGLPGEIKNHVAKYLGESSQDYYISVSENGASWWVCYANVTDDIRDVLAGKAFSDGLKSNYGNKDNTIALRIR